MFAHFVASVFVPVAIIFFLGSAFILPFIKSSDSDKGEPPESPPGPPAKRLFTSALVTSAAMLALGGCGVPLYSNTSATVPTPAGNGRVRMTNVGGLVVSTEVENPPGIIDACLRVRREWNDYLIRTQQPNTENVWTSWMRQMSLLNAPNECMNYATYGMPLPANNAGVGGTGVNYGAGPYSGRYW